VSPHNFPAHPHPQQQQQPRASRHNLPNMGAFISKGEALEPAVHPLDSQDEVSQSTRDFSQQWEGGEQEERGHKRQRIKDNEESKESKELNDDDHTSDDGLDPDPEQKRRRLECEGEGQTRSAPDDQQKDLSLVMTPIKSQEYQKSYHHAELVPGSVSPLAKGKSESKEERQAEIATPASHFEETSFQGLEEEFGEGFPSTPSLISSSPLEESSEPEDSIKRRANTPKISEEDGGVIFEISNSKRFHVV
jgi:hypothetical protein